MSNQYDYEQLAFQKRQDDLIPGLYDGLPASRRAMLEEYDENIRELTDVQRDTWHCAIVDPDLYQLYSDLYKDDHGCRPRGYVNVATVTEWVRQRGIR